MDRQNRPSSCEVSTARISMPTARRSDGWAIRLTDIPAIGSSAVSPTPISQNAPKCSSRVTRADRISPGRKSARRRSRQSCCAARRDRIARILPSGCSSIPVTVNAAGRDTRDSSAISRVDPSAMPSAPSSRGITPSMHGRSTYKLWPASQRSTRASKICSSRIAAESPAAVATAVRFAAVSSNAPSGKN